MGSVGENIDAENALWTFENESTVNSFEEHVSTSVPMYKEGHDLILRMSDFFLEKDSNLYEIGSSTGILCDKFYQRNKNKKINIVGIDISEKMVEYANKHYDNENCSFIFDDILNVEMKDADIIVAYYTIQFIRPAYRQEIINKIYKSLRWGGAFFMFEKTRASDARFQDIVTSVYFDYKLEQGYSKEEIMSKYMSLKGVLEPFSTDGNIKMLERAGFEDVNTIFKYVPFEGFLAIK